MEKVAKRRKKGELKTCTKCGHEKPHTDEYFPRKYSGGKVVGLTSHCKSCKSEYMLAYYRRHREKYLKLNKEWAEANPERHAAIERKSRIKHRYGMTLEEHVAMYRSQGGLCAVCGEPIDYNKCCTDHDHCSGEVRGMLCYPCNIFVGYVDTRGHLIPRIVEYIGGMDGQTESLDEQRYIDREEEKGLAGI